MSALNLQQEYYTYTDIIKMDDDIRRELIDGVIYNMASPLNVHQDIMGEIFNQLKNFLKGKNCKVYIAPFDVRLNADKPNKEDDTVLQPDVLVICDRSKLDPKGRGCKGAPDLVIEVLSPSTAYRDRHIKYNKYLEHGVREYWIVDPAHNIVEAHILENDMYKIYYYQKTDSLPVHVLEGCEIDLSSVFIEEEE